MAPTISIGIPFWNAERTLFCAIQSVFAQTITDWELILVDDGSVDRSLLIAKAVNDRRVCVLSDGLHKGLGARLNEIANKAQGRYLARMDADDAMCPDRLEKQLKYLAAHPHCDVLGTGMFVVDRQLLPKAVRIATPTIASKAALYRGPLMHATVVGRTEWFRSHSYHEQLLRSEDRELWLRTFSASSFANLSEPLYLVCESDSFTLSKYISSSRELTRLFLKFGPSIVGWPRTIQYVLATLAKDVLHIIASTLSLSDHLIHLRSRSVSESEVTKCLEAGAVVLATRVPLFTTALELGFDLVPHSQSTASGIDALGDQ